MKALNWLWIAVVLITANAILFTLGQISPPPANDEEQQQVAPLDPRLPVVELASEAGNEALQTGCWTIGPLPTLLAQQRARDRIAAHASRVELRQTEADRDRGWWVHVPAGSRSQALELTRDLAEKGVDDYYIIAGGTLENAVSVGLYENLDNARQRQRRIRALGFDARLEVRRETTPQFWIDYHVEDGGNPPWKYVVRASPGSQRIRVPCGHNGNLAQTKR